MIRRPKLLMPVPSLTALPYRVHVPGASQMEAALPELPVPHQGGLQKRLRLRRWQV